MVFQEVSWVRCHVNKLCPVFRTQVLGWYRPARHTRCFINKPIKAVKQKWIIGFKDFISRSEEPYDDNDPGTHVAGCAVQVGKVQRENIKARRPRLTLSV